MSIIIRTVILFFCILLPLPETLANENGLRELIFARLDSIARCESFSGNLAFDREGIFGDMRLLLRGEIFADNRQNIISLYFEGEKLNCEIDASLYQAPFSGTISATILPDSLFGIGRLSSKKILLDFGFNSVQDENGDYFLDLQAIIHRLEISGEIDNLLPLLNKLLWTVERKCLNPLGFSSLILSLKGDSCIRFDGLDVNCIASLDFKSDIAGDVSGKALTESGNIIRFGKPFILDSAAYNFSTGSIYALAKLQEKAFIQKKDIGAVIQNFDLELRYFGLFPDSVLWELTSEPQLRPEQIISLLVKSDPYSKNIPLQATQSLEDRIKNALDKYNSRRFTEFTEKQVGRLFALDRVEIEGESFSLDSPYEADKELSDRLRLSFRGTVGGTTKQTVSFDYRLYQDFYFISETNQTGETGLDLRYKIKFK